MGNKAKGETARRRAILLAGKYLLGKKSPHSILSFFSVGSILSVGSVLSIGSSGSILSIGSAGSILSIGSAGSILGLGSVGYSPSRSQEDPPEGP